MMIKNCPIGKILNTSTNRCVKIDGKIGKEIIKTITLEKKDNKNKFKYLIINKPITYNIDENDVILDPAGLNYMKTNFSGAGFASGSIYKLLSTSKPNSDVIKYFSQFKNEDYLYEKNKKKLRIAYYTSYNNGNIKIIHAIGPDFRYSYYLQKIIKSDDLTDLYKLIYKIYKDIYKTFIKEYELNKNLKLRLLPISAGVFINNNKDYKLKIFKCLKKIYKELYSKYKILPVIYFYDKDDYYLFKNI